MLVLTRKLGEKIVIGDDVTLAILSVKGNRVRLGIQAPADIAVLREEIATRPGRRATLVGAPVET